MAGIYIHVPFCKKRCHYCDFYKVTDTTLTNYYISALSSEINLRSNFFKSNFDNSPLNSEIIETIYLGGGTPSTLSLKNLDLIFTQLWKVFNVSPTAEVTVEVNPDDVTVEYIKGLHLLGVNRLSMGLQSFDDDYLKLMNRRHNAQQALKSVEYILTAGISNFSIDLIYGLPEMTLNKWKETLDIAFSLPVNHLSAYHLMYEQGTKFYDWKTDGKLTDIDEDTSWQQFEMLHNVAENKGFDHYEISNLAKPGFYSKHNSNYWNGIPYLGLGLSAHSFIGNERQWNVPNVQQYINALKHNEVFWEAEILSVKDKVNECIMTALRTKEGINIDVFNKNFGNKRYQLLQKTFESYINSGHIILSDNKIALSLKGWFISDKIISTLMQIS